MSIGDSVAIVAVFVAVGVLVRQDIKQRRKRAEMAANRESIERYATFHRKFRELCVRRQQLRQEDRFGSPTWIAFEEDVLMTIDEFGKFQKGPNPWRPWQEEILADRAQRVVRFN